MPSNAQDITSYAFSGNDRLLFDANVWLFVYGPNKPGDTRAATYSRALADIIAAGSIIYIDVVILSEFINRYARLRYNIARGSGRVPDNFKTFRNGADFKPVAQEIAEMVRRVLRTCSRTESGFASVDIGSLINEYGKGESDFNDQILAELCRSQDLSFVTDDGDFKGFGLSVITANRKLLN
ncbi:MAG TPA: PIN domain-containing protein [Terriglobia bacterium]|nr:PIN domain-containing protein [Terriglobia bacterium]